MKGINLFFMGLLAVSSVSLVSCGGSDDVTTSGIGNPGGQNNNNNVVNNGNTNCSGIACFQPTCKEVNTYYGPQQVCGYDNEGVNNMRQSLTVASFRQQANPREIYAACFSGSACYYNNLFGSISHNYDDRTAISDTVNNNGLIYWSTGERNFNNMYNQPAMTSLSYEEVVDWIRNTVLEPSNIMMNQQTGLYEINTVQVSMGPYAGTGFVVRHNNNKVYQFSLDFPIGANYMIDRQNYLMRVFLPNQL
jgi:hypothetical protein